eukprot:105602-Pelagomonas_calceolata.AAC.7
MNTQRNQGCPSELMASSDHHMLWTLDVSKQAHGFHWSDHAGRLIRRNKLMASSDHIMLDT